MRSDNSIDCVCVIHGDLYPWVYVEKLYSMITRNLSATVRFHVFTEPQRPVPSHMIKHCLVDWPGVAGRRKGWWYKMQMFDSSQLPGQVLYLDLDTVIVDSLDWIMSLDAEYFWAIKDFKHIWRSNWQGINSSVMYWNNSKFSNIWQDFQRIGIAGAVKRYTGDQDFISEVLPAHQRKFFDDSLIRSWRWQIKDGGLDPKTRKYHNPGTGSVINPGAAILVFHGQPKPHEIQEDLILQNWN